MMGRIRARNTRTSKPSSSFLLGFLALLSCSNHYHHCQKCWWSSSSFGSSSGCIFCDAASSASDNNPWATERRRTSAGAGDKRRRGPPPPPRPPSTTISRRGRDDYDEEYDGRTSYPKYYRDSKEHEERSPPSGRGFAAESYGQEDGGEAVDGRPYQENNNMDEYFSRMEGRDPYAYDPAEPAQFSSEKSRGGPEPTQRRGIAGDSTTTTSGKSMNRPPPIHYQFPASKTATAPGQEDEGPVTGRPARASARSDPVTLYWTRSTAHRLRMMVAAAILGASGGAFVGQSVLPATTRALALTGAFVFTVGMFLRTVFGELVRCLALALIRAVWSLGQIRRRYPTHVTACLGGIRHPFPAPGDEDFPRLYAMIAAGMVGSLVLGTFPLLPTWLGALAGLGIGSLSTTLPDARGDLARCVGMRVVALMQETATLNRELQIVPKCLGFAEAVWDRLLFLDRQHRLKDRVGRAVSWIYEKTTSVINDEDENYDGVETRSDSQQQRNKTMRRDNDGFNARPPPPRSQRRRPSEESQTL